MTDEQWVEFEELGKRFYGVTLEYRRYVDPIYWKNYWRARLHAGKHAEYRLTVWGASAEEVVSVLLQRTHEVSRRSL